MTSANNNIIHAIGNTPMIELKNIVPQGSSRIIAKLESANPTGSMKDRMAKAVIAQAEKKGFIKKGSTIVEYTAGTTGISLAFVCASLGYNFHAVFSDAFSNEKRITMKAFGATITDVPSDNKKITERLININNAKNSFYFLLWFCQTIIFFALGYLSAWQPELQISIVMLC